MIAAGSGPRPVFATGSTHTAAALLDRARDAGAKGDASGVRLERAVRMAHVGGRARGPNQGLIDAEPDEESIAVLLLPAS